MELRGERIDPEAFVDLHMHTTASDGGWTPPQLISHLHERDFRVAAVADHDSMDSVPAMIELGRDAGIEVIPAVEMTTRWEDRQVHCLIYGIHLERPESRLFRELLDDQQRRLAEMSEHIVKLLDQHGRVVPSLDDVAAGRSLKPYLVYQAMIRDGHGYDARTAHNIVKGLGEPGLVDVPLSQTVEAAHEAGALAIIAHPGRDDGWGVLRQPELDRMLAEIPFDGVEGHYRSYSEEDTEYYRRWAADRGKLVSTGSDSHRPGFPVDPKPHPAKWAAGLLERLGYLVVPFEGAAWVPPEPAAASSS